MPQLVKGAKWCFGWVVVTPMLRLLIPPDAWDEYGFRFGEDALFLPGSKRSGGYGLTSPRLLAEYSDSISLGLSKQLLAKGCFGNGVVFLPLELKVKTRRTFAGCARQWSSIGVADQGFDLCRSLQTP